MAVSNENKAGNKTNKTTARTAKTAKSTKSTRTSAQRKKAEAQRMAQDSVLFHEIGLILLFAVMLILFCCNFGIIGPVGNTVSGVLFGLFGLTAYAVPALIFLAVAFWFANEGNPNAARKLAAGVVLFLMVGIVCGLLAKGIGSTEKYDPKLLYESCRDNKAGGGVLTGSIGFFLRHYLGTIGTVLVVILCSVISLILLTEKSLISSVKKGGSRMRELSREGAERRREYAQVRREQAELDAQARKEQAEIRREQARAKKEQAELKKEQAWARRQEQEEQRRLKAEEKENEKILRMEKKVSGVMMDTTLPRPEETLSQDDMHEITMPEETDEELMPMQEPSETIEFDIDKIQVRGVHQVMVDEEPEENQELTDEWGEELPDIYMPDSQILSEYQAMPEPQMMPETASVPEPAVMPELSVAIHKDGYDEGPEETGPISRYVEIPMESETEPASAPEEPAASVRQKPAARLAEDSSNGQKAQAGTADELPKAPKPYMFPPISLLQKGAAVTGDSARELKETAMHLQQTLATFGVKVTITDISQGPSVTRYEMQPEQGVKVSKIVGLTDDIKLNLAATDIRIEAPIPGKAAVGIEVPNKETMPVALRDLLESSEFRDFKSNIAFAVGKDIGGKVVVSDIAKMPHMLIAGATGSGKSVCINTLIMSILYKAHPDDVKLIMVDPKVVELSVYNGIPHLLIPVVTDPKKASAALHWGVAEMDDRYKKFAEYNVRDLKGYNKKIEGEGLPKLPQIVIIVDELADLMMVCPGEVEESICRLAQLARAAGIHLIIATQRPSVDVITGLIKANMPSRVAFSVSSGVDSRTILDMVGAEKLLGKGDMLFYPQGYSKPARVQGAFVSDKEVFDVVDFLKNQAIGNTYAADIEERIKNMGSQAGGGGASSGGSEVDDLFERAGRLIIDKDKASIGMLQRSLGIGFNRAARIMDQLCQYGVVGEEEGTKPRKILMGPEQFEEVLEEVG